MTSISVELGPDISGFEPLLDTLVEDRVASRIFAHDATLWGSEASAEAAVRLGWTDIEAPALALIPEIEALRAEFNSVGVSRIVLCGMGGSSLAPAVITREANVALTMIDTTHPAAIARLLSSDLSNTAVVVSSKSGSTIETRSHLAAFERAFESAGIDPATRIVIVTDPGSPLDVESREAGRRVFNADPNVGGRFAALTAFGLVPSGLAGADLRALIAEAQEVRSALSEDARENPALLLAAALANGLPQRFLLATRPAQDADWGLEAWIEQLVAESTGKEGKGVLPLALEMNAAEFSAQGESTLFARIVGAVSAPPSERRPGEERGILVAAALGAQFLLWEVATAALGRLMNIDPFNQPDVESAKVAARGALDGRSEADTSEVSEPVAAPLPSPTALDEWLRESVDSHGYLVIQAYLDPHAPYAGDLRQLRDALAQKLGVPVALGFGPSYLHSTGQLHKGGPAVGAFIQIIDRPEVDIEIPGLGHTFGELIAAQAEGDRNVLTALGRPVLTLKCEDPASAVRGLLG